MGDRRRLDHGMATDSRKQLGRRGEALAAQHLERAGWRIVDRNYSVREGEIDLIAARGSTLVFCEVKTLVDRAHRRRGPANPIESVGRDKRARVRRMARMWLAAQVDQGASPRASEVRLDVIGVVLAADGSVMQLEHIQGAF
jgi:putative endonuclease